MSLPKFNWTLAGIVVLAVLLLAIGLCQVGCTTGAAVTGIAIQDEPGGPVILQTPADIGRERDQMPAAAAAAASVPRAFTSTNTAR